LQETLLECFITVFCPHQTQFVIRTSFSKKKKTSHYGGKMGCECHFILMFLKMDVMNFNQTGTSTHTEADWERAIRWQSRISHSRGEENTD